MRSAAYGGILVHPRAFAAITTAVLMLVSVNALSKQATASEVPLAMVEPPMTYGPGYAITNLPDGSVRFEYLPTFQRWDGAWRPTSALDRALGEWPFLVEESLTDFRITRLGQSFRQVKMPLATYEILLDGVKETFPIILIPPEPLLSVVFESNYSVEVDGLAIRLRDSSGAIAWTTAQFHAWDSADPPRTWDQPITSLSYSTGVVSLTLNATMLAEAAYPIFVDPTWVTSASTGWASISTRDNVTEDYGDHNFRLGWFADNFNDNTKDSVWLTDTGSSWETGGAAQLNLSTRIRASSSRWDTKFQGKVTITSSFASFQTARMLFRWQDSLNYHALEIDQLNDIVALKRVTAGAATTIWSTSKTIAPGVPYLIKIDAFGGAFTVVWDGAVLWSGTDPGSPNPGPTANVGLETTGAPITVDDVRAWAAALGSVETVVRNAGANGAVSMRTAHTDSLFDLVDLQVRSSPDNVVWGDPQFVKAGAKSATLDADAYNIQDDDRKPYYRSDVVLRSTDDLSPALSEVATVEAAVQTASSDNSQLLGYEPWQYYVGGMVNVVNGNLLLQATDLRLPAKGWSLVFTRSYNSLSGSSGPLGLGWTHSYNANLAFPGGGDVNFNDGDGSTHFFKNLGGGRFGSPRGLSGTKLIQNGDLTYAMSSKDGTKWTFSSAGKVAVMDDRNGNSLTMTYDGNGRLTKIADESGVFLLLAYDANGRIIKVGDQNGTVSQQSPTAHTGSWSNGQNGFSSNNLYATSSTDGATHRYSSYGFSGSGSAWITKVEACVEAKTAGDDDLGVKVSTDAGVTWSAEQVVNLPTADTFTCLDFTSHRSSWTWTDLSNTNFRIEIRYVKVGGTASTDSLDWIPVKVTTANRFVSYAYDGSGNLASVTDPLGQSELFLYTAKLDRFVDRANKSLRFVRDGSSKTTEVWTGLYNRTTSSIQWEFRQYLIAYGTWQTRQATVTDASGNVTTITYDRLAGRPTLIDGPLAASGTGCSCCGSSGNEKWTIQWNGENNWVYKLDGRASRTKATWDGRANPVRQTDTQEKYTENTWQNRDNGTVFDSLVMKQRNRRGFTTSNAFDWEGNPTKTTDALGNFTQSVYDASGFVTKTTDRRNFNTTYTYDVHGWRLNTTDALGHVTKTEYDTVGRVVKTTTALGFVSRKAYNANDWVVIETNPLGFTTKFQYNARGDRTAVVDANGNQTTSVVNVTWGKVQKNFEATGDVTENTYDKLGRLGQVKDPDGKLWTYEYDKFNRKTKEKDPFLHLTQRVYDAAGNVVTRIDGNAKYTNSTYDTLNRLTQVSYQDGNTLTYAYDANGNRMTETGYGFTRTSEYDALDRLTKMTFNFGSFLKIVQYTYDQNGNRKTMVYPDGFTVTYVWDADNRLANIQITGQTWTFTYDADHRRTSATHPNGLQLNATYDNAGRLTAIRSKDAGSTVEGFTYTYDKVANRKTQGQEANSTSLSFAYDKEYELNTTTYEAGSKAYYQYDANDNRLFRNETGKQTKYFYGVDSSISRREEYAGGSLRVTNNYTYDSNGNRVQNVKAVIGQGTTTYNYQYDLENRLVKVLSGNTEITSYAYFSDGSRIRRTASGVATYFLYDFRDFNGYNDIIAEYDTSGNMVARYVHGPGDDEPLAMSRGGSWYYYHIDGLGSVTMLTRADKTVANRYVYDDFGGFRSRTEAVANPYTYTGREYDSAVDLIFYRARYYDPLTGRFLTRDPAGIVDGANVYVYTGNNPVNRVDPSGLCGFWDIGCVIRENFCMISCSFLLGLGVAAVAAAGAAKACYGNIYCIFGITALAGFFAAPAIGAACAALCHAPIGVGLLTGLVTWAFIMACVPALWWDPLALAICIGLELLIGAVYAAMLANLAPYGVYP